MDTINYYNDYIENFPDPVMKQYLQEHKKEFIEWKFDHEDFPMDEFYKVAGIELPTDEAILKAYIEY